VKLAGAMVWGAFVTVGAGDASRLPSDIKLAIKPTLKSNLWSSTEALTIETAPRPIGYCLARKLSLPYRLHTDIILITFTDAKQRMRPFWAMV